MPTAQDSDEDVRKAAIDGIVAVAFPGDSLAATSVIRALSDSDEYVRLAAVQGVAALCKPGANDLAVGPLVQCLRDSDDDVRTAAVAALGKIVDPRGGPVVDKVLECFDDSNSAVRVAAANALVHLVARGDIRALAATRLLLCKDPDAAVRIAAAQLLAFAAEMGDSDTVSNFLSCIDEDDDEDVRAEALAAMASLAQKCDARCIAVACKCLSDDSRDVRSAAVRALSMLASPGDTHTLDTIIPMLAHEQLTVRISVLRALKSIISRGNQAVLDLMPPYLTYEDSDIRYWSVQLVASTAHKGDESQKSAILERLHDDDEDVRRAAAEALAQIAQAEDVETCAALMHALGDEDSDVRRAAVDSLGAVGVAQSQPLVEALANCLRDEDEDVRIAAVSALVIIAGSENVWIITNLESRLVDADVDVRRIAAYGLARLAQVDVKRTAGLLTGLLEVQDDAEAMRGASVEALSFLASSSANCSAVLGVMLHRWPHGTSFFRVAILEVGAILVSYGQPDAATKLFLWGFADPAAEVRAESSKCLGRFCLPQPTCRLCQVRPVEGIHNIAVCDEKKQDELVSVSNALLNACQDCIGDSKPAARNAASDAITAAWPQGSCAVVAAFLEDARLHESQVARRYAVACLAVATKPLMHRSIAGGQGIDCACPVVDVVDTALHSIAASLEEEDERVRNAAVKALGSLAPLQDTWRSTLLPALGPMLRHSNASVRCSGAEAVSAAFLVQGGDAEATAALLPLADDSDEDVQWAALLALGQVGATGGGPEEAAALAVAKRRAAEASDDQVRVAAIRTLGALGQKGDPDILSFLSACIRGSSPPDDVEREAASAMMKLFDSKAAEAAVEGYGEAAVAA